VTAGQANRRVRCDDLLSVADRTDTARLARAPRGRWIFERMAGAAATLAEALGRGLVEAADLSR
jgi:hypothetical protein